MSTVRPVPRAHLPSGEVLDGLLGLLAFLLLAASWATHVVVCATGGLWSLLALGVLFFPLAVANGVAIWMAGL